MSKLFFCAVVFFTTYADLATRMTVIELSAYFVAGMSGAAAYKYIFEDKT
jgi:hypothetical protein